MKQYKTASGIYMPCRRKPVEVEKRDPEQLGCSNCGCVFHPDRREGTAGVCDCPSGELTEAERKFIRTRLIEEPS